MGSKLQDGNLGLGLELLRPYIALNPSDIGPGSPNRGGPHIALTPVSQEILSPENSVALF